MTAAIMREAVFLRFLGSEERQMARAAPVRPNIANRTLPFITYLLTSMSYIMPGVLRIAL